MIDRTEPRPEAAASDDDAGTPAARASAHATPQALAGWLREAQERFYSDAAGSLSLAERVLQALDARAGAEGDAPPPPWPAADALGDAEARRWLAPSAEGQRSRALAKRGIALVNLGRGAEGVASVEAALAACPAGDVLSRAEALQAMAIVHEQLGALEEGLRWATEHAELARTLGDPLRMAAARMAVGILKSRGGDHEGGLAEYLVARDLLQHGADSGNLSNALVNIGIACKNLGRFDEAVAHLREGLALAERDGRAAAQAMVRANLAEPLARTGRLDEAIAEARAAAESLAAHQLPIPETFARSMLGRLLAERGDHDAAGPELRRALELAERTGSANHVAQAQLALARWHKAAGRFEAALAHHEAFHEAERRQVNEASQRAQREMAARFDLAQARHDAELQRRHAAELAALSRTDALTGLANRRAFDERLADALAHAARQREPLALAILDLDDFKRINDRFGHPVGDAVLQAAAAVLRGALRASDLVARYGGEEFVVAFPATSLDGARHACEQLRAALAGHDWPALHPGLAVTTSIGIAAIAETGADRVALLREADRRLYDAKRQGKNRVQAG